jgi:hypothetical protein
MTTAAEARDRAARRLPERRARAGLATYGSGAGPRSRAPLPGRLLGSGITREQGGGEAGGKPLLVLVQGPAAF